MLSIESCAWPGIERDRLTHAFSRPGEERQNQLAAIAGALAAPICARPRYSAAAGGAWSESRIEAHDFVIVEARAKGDGAHQRTLAGDSRLN